MIVNIELDELTNLKTELEYYKKKYSELQQSDINEKAYEIADKYFKNILKNAGFDFESRNFISKSTFDNGNFDTQITFLIGEDFKKIYLNYINK